MIKTFRSSMLAAVMCISFSVYAQPVFQTKQLTLIEATEESDADIHEMVKELSGTQGDPRSSRELGSQILELVGEDENISEYDYLWTLYSLVINAGPEMDGGMPVNDYLKITDAALNYLDNNGIGEWVFTDLGQFKIEVYKQAANGAAWALKDDKPKEALRYIELGMNHMGEQDQWMQDTQVRILLNLNEKIQAYTIVQSVLEENPGFVDFQDFPNNQSYIDWLESK